MTSRRLLALRAPNSDSPRIPAVGKDWFDRSWWRAHDPANTAWWFASAEVDDDDGGRFDLALDDGTCYIATTGQAAIAERLGHVGSATTWTKGMLAGTAVSDVTPLPRHLVDAVDTLHPEALKAITREISTTERYDLTRQWAAHWRENEGRTGVLYEPRFCTDRDARSFAIFGKAGTVDAGSAGAPRPAVDLVDPSAVASSIALRSATITA